MKLLFVALVASLCVPGLLGYENHCTITYSNVPDKWLDMGEQCAEKLRDQVIMEMNAAITYLSMGAHFALDTVNRPGFSKFFFEAASEERQHAIKIIEYLQMRGQSNMTASKKLWFDPLKMGEKNWQSGEIALQEALNTESNVTESLREIIRICENPTKASKKTGKKFNDYHLVDYLSGDFLDEQYKGQRDLAGKLTTLGKMTHSQGKYGEFLFDKKLLNGEV